LLTTFTALYDANVLYSATLRSLLVYLAMSELFRARWTERIHDEWTESLLRERPDLLPENLAKTRKLMNAHVEASIISGYESLVEGLQLPDPKDRHVLAAAIHGRADVIVTYDLKDFPASTLACYGIEAQHPDIFITHLFDLNPWAVIESVQRQRSHLKNPSVSAEAFLDKLERLQLPLTAWHLREYLEIL